MLNAITPIASTAGGGNAQIAYLNDQENFKEAVRSDQINYFAHDEANAEFIGKGAERLGIKGDIKNFSEVEALAEGFHPNTGKKLAYNAGANHDKGFEFALSADKTVSLLGMLGTPEQQKAVNDAHREAVKEACAFIESLDLARKGKNGMVKMAGELVFSVFHHKESRELDPQIHSHVILNNLSFADGKWGSLDSKALYENKMAVGQIYQNALARGLVGRGIAIEANQLENGIACAIKGIPEKLAETFSKRSKQIANYLSENGLADTRANRQIATLETRAAKQKGAELDSLKDDWRREAAAVGFTPEAIAKAVQSQSKTDFGEFKEGAVLSRFNDAVMTTHGSKATKANLLFSSLQEAFGKVSTAEAKKAVIQLLEGDEILRIDGKRITTKALISAEEKLLSWGLGTRKTNVIKDKKSAEKAKSIIVAMSEKPFTAEQSKAIDEILFNPHNIVNIVGKAGTGKSTLLKAAVLAARADGKAVYGTATAGKAATGLEDCGMTAVENTAKLLHQLNRGSIKLSEGDIVICDEVGMLNTGQYEALAGHCEKAGAKFVAVGDYEQLQAIGAGGMHKLLCEKLGACKLTQVFRQKDAAEAQAGLQISAGNAAEAIKLYKDEGRYTVAATKAAMGRELAKNFTESPAAYDEKIAIADTRGQARDISKNIHNIRKEKGELGQCHSIEIKDPNENNDQPLRQEFAPGDRIAFLKGSKADNPITGKDGKPAKVQNGHFGTITKIEKTENGFSLTVNHDKLGEVQFSTDTYDTFSLGYCVTTHKSQGATMRECHYATERPDKHKAYVGATRHTDKGGFHLYTTKAADNELAGRMTKANYNESALEALASVKAKQGEAEAAKARIADRKTTKSTAVQLSRVKVEALPERKVLTHAIESLAAAKSISGIPSIANARTLSHAPHLTSATPMPTTVALRPKLQKPQQHIKRNNAVPTAKTAITQQATRPTSERAIEIMKNAFDGGMLAIAKSIHAFNDFKSVIDEKLEARKAEAKRKADEPKFIGAFQSVIDEASKTEEGFQKLLRYMRNAKERSFSISDIQDKESRNALHIAAIKSDSAYSVAHSLVCHKPQELQAMLRQKDVCQKTPLNYLEERKERQREQEKREQAIQEARKLLQDVKDAIPQLKASREAERLVQQELLITACKNNDCELAIESIQRGADFRQADSNGHTPVTIAQKSGSKSVLELFNEIANQKQQLLDEQLRRDLEFKEQEKVRREVEAKKEATLKAEREAALKATRATTSSPTKHHNAVCEPRKEMVKNENRRGRGLSR